MTFKKGDPKPPNSGKQKGTENMVTIATKEIILGAIDKMAVDFMPTMEVIREKNPIEWAKIMVKLMDFVLPKKLDVTSDNKPITTQIFKIGDQEIEL